MSQAPKIAVVEDEEALSVLLRYNLEAEGYQVDTMLRGDEAEIALRENVPDLLILDWMLPGVSGIELCRRLRQWQETERLPIIMLTARGDEPDKVAGLDAGADDYIVKPYDLDELLARMRALIRRSAGRAEPVFEHEGITIDPQSHAATVDGTPVPLTAREWAVLEPLIARPGMIFSRAQLEEKLYSWKDSVSSNAVEVYIHGLRKKLGPNLIQNVRGVGYVIPKT